MEMSQFIDLRCEQNSKKKKKKILPITSMSAFGRNTDKTNSFVDDPSRRGGFYQPF